LETVTIYCAGNMRHRTAPVTKADPFRWRTVDDRRRRY
jgi:hypothetical protein